MLLSEVTLGTNDLERARGFYDAIMGVLGAKRLLDLDRETVYGHSMKEPMLGILKPFDGKPASVGVYVWFAHTSLLRHTHAHIDVQ